ncbi:Diacetylchitobiose uptake system permease protein NgcF [subsurface metagenome]
MLLKREKMGTWKRIKKEKWSYILLAVPLAMIFLVYILPFIWCLIIGFTTYFPGREMRWVGMKNYMDAFQDAIFLKSARNTFIYALGVIPGGLIIALVLSYLIFLLPKPAGTFFKSAFYLPVVTSGVILSLVWLWLFNPVFGFLNYLLSLFHLPSIMWLGSPKTALPSLIFMNLATAHGGSIILLTATMGNIPTSLYESARLDGSNRWQEFWYITFPLLRPIILFLLITGAIFSFKVFTQIYVMTQGGPNYATVTLVYRIFVTAFDLFNYGLAFAETIIFGIALIIIAFLQYKYFSMEIEY